MPHQKTLLVLSFLIATPSIVSAGSLSLAWDPSPDSSVVGYVVQWGDRSGQPTDEESVGDVSTHTIRGLVDGRTYYVVVRANTADGTRSRPSNQAFGVARSPSVGGLPPAPTPDSSDPLPDDSAPNPDDLVPTPDPAVPLQVIADFDGDLRADVAIYRPLKSVWQVSGSTGLGLFISDFEAHDREVVPVPADYDGDGATDVARWFPASGLWVIYASGSDFRSASEILLGSVRSVPVPADYDGDGFADYAVVEPGGLWRLLGEQPRQFGRHGDIPVPADYDGDGAVDMALFRPSTGTWFVDDQFEVDFGEPDDLPVPADYDGDGLVDVAVFRPSTSTWYVRGQFQVEFGMPGDIPVPLDTDGDGRAEFIVSRPTDGDWYMLDERTGLVETLFYGEPGDVVASVSLSFRTIDSAPGQQP